MENSRASLKKRIVALFKLNNTPEEIALGVAIGVFIAITPLYGFHTIMVIVAALSIRRVNKFAILLGTNISTTLTFPFITWTGYSIGRSMLGDAYPPLRWSMFRHFDYRQILHFYFPLLLGSVILGLFLAVLFYFLTLGIITLRKKAHSKQKIVSSILLVALASLASLAALGLARPAHAYQYEGEKINYAISPVGRAEYRDAGSAEIEGKPARLSIFTTKVLWFDDTEKIYYDLGTFLPLRVEREVDTLLGREYIVENYATADGALVIEKFKHGRKVKEYTFKGDGPIQNAVLLPFYLRTVADLEVGWSFVARFPLKFTITLISIDELEIAGSKMLAYHFTSDPDKFEVWISKDKYRIPVKIKGKGGFKHSLIMKEYSTGQKE